MLQRPLTRFAATRKRTGALSLTVWPPEPSVPVMTPVAVSVLPWASNRVILAFMVSVLVAASEVAGTTSPTTTSAAMSSSIRCRIFVLPRSLLGCRSRTRSGDPDNGEEPDLATQADRLHVRGRVLVTGNAEEGKQVVGTDCCQPLVVAHEVTAFGGWRLGEVERVDALRAAPRAPAVAGMAQVHVGRDAILGRCLVVARVVVVEDGDVAVVPNRDRVVE